MHFYYLAVYWTVTTITTVGYGDINSRNNAERMFASLAMILGVVTFTFATGTLSSIIANYDSTNAKLEEKTDFLEKIRSDFKMPFDLYVSVKQAMDYQTDFHDMEELSNFLNDLPHKLKTQVSLCVYKEKFKDMKFFHN